MRNILTGILKILSITVIILISGCVAQITETGQTQETPEQTQPIEEMPKQPTEGTLQGEVAPQQEQISSIPPLPTVKEFTIEADDKGFYIDDKDVSSVSVSKDNFVKIAFKVREAGTYYGGLDFRGCGQDTPDTKPGASVDIQFTADSTCEITSYWPVSNVVKDSMQVVVS